MYRKTNPIKNENKKRKKNIKKWTHIQLGLFRSLVGQDRAETTGQLSHFYAMINEYTISVAPLAQRNKIGMNSMSYDFRT